MAQIGRYEILNEVGRGAMGVVFAAYDPMIGRKVAVKTINLHALQDDSARAEMQMRLRREARSAGVLSHPGIITIYDIGEQGEDAFIVMEFVNGSTMEQVLSSGIPQHSGFLLKVIRGAAEALDYAHSKGIIHRDIKPSNIMLLQDGSIKIADFGVAKISDATGLTHTGLVLGTPNYMSPEQARAQAVDGRSDQFSLAVVAFRILTGKLPFQGPTLTAVLSRILWEAPEYHGSDFAPEIQTVFNRALSKDPENRFPTCGDFAASLDAAYQSVRPRTGESEAAPETPVKEPAEDNSTAMVVSAPAPRSAALRKIEAEDATGPALDFIRTEEPAQPAREPKPGSKEGEAAALLAAFDSETPEPASPAEPPAAPEAAAPRSLLPMWLVAGVLIVLIITAAYFAYRWRSEQTPAAQVLVAEPTAPITNRSAEPIPPPEPPQVQELPAAAPDLQPKPAAPVRAASKKPRKTPPVTVPAPVSAQPPSTPAPAVSEPAESAPQAAAAPKPAERIPESAPTRGVITWSGRMGKNTILILNEGGASFGQASGTLPGVPVTVEVEPKSIRIQSRPSPANGWKLLMLRSGKQAVESITIRWHADH